VLPAATTGGVDATGVGLKLAVFSRKQLALSKLAAADVGSSNVWVQPCTQSCHNDRPTVTVSRMVGCFTHVSWKNASVTEQQPVCMCSNKAVVSCM
jgi:hypothetical protein